MSVLPFYNYPPVSGDQNRFQAAVGLTYAIAHIKTVLSVTDATTRYYKYKEEREEWHDRCSVSTESSNDMRPVYMLTMPEDTLKKLNIMERQLRDCNMHWAFYTTLQLGGDCIFIMMEIQNYIQSFTQSLSENRHAAFDHIADAIDFLGVEMKKYGLVKPRFVQSQICSWSFDELRKDWYHWSQVDGCWVYQQGLKVWPDGTVAEPVIPESKELIKKDGQDGGVMEMN